MQCFTAVDIEEANKLEYEQNCWKFGLKKEWFGEEVFVGGKNYKIVGVFPRARK